MRSACVGHDSRNQQTIEYEPFYAFRHASNSKGNRAFWHATRRVSEIDDDLPTQLFLSLVNQSGGQCDIDADSLMVFHVIAINIVFFRDHGLAT